MPRPDESNPLVIRFYYLLIPLKTHVTVAQQTFDILGGVLYIVVYANPPPPFSLSLLAFQHISLPRKFPSNFFSANPSSSPLPAPTHTREHKTNKS